MVIKAYIGIIAMNSGTKIGALLPLILGVVPDLKGSTETLAQSGFLRTTRVTLLFKNNACFFGDPSSHLSVSCLGTRTIYYS